MQCSRTWLKELQWKTRTQDFKPRHIFQTKNFKSDIFQGLFKPRNLYFKDSFQLHENIQIKKVSIPENKSYSASSFNSMFPTNATTKKKKRQSTP